MLLDLKVFWKSNWTSARRKAGSYSHSTERDPAKASKACGLVDHCFTLPCERSSDVQPSPHELDELVQIWGRYELGARANYFGFEHDSSTASTLNNRTIDGLHRAAFTRLLRFDLGQPFYGWFRMANPVLQAVSTGLMDRFRLSSL